MHWLVLDRTRDQECTTACTFRLLTLPSIALSSKLILMNIYSKKNQYEIGKDWIRIKAGKFAALLQVLNSLGQKNPIIKFSSEWKKWKYNFVVRSSLENSSVKLKPEDIERDLQCSARGRGGRPEKYALLILFLLHQELKKCKCLFVRLSVQWKVSKYSSFSLHP